MRLTIHETAVFLAQAGAGNPGGQGEDFGKSSPMGLLVVILFGIAVVFLIRSMTRHLKKLPTTFDEERAAAAAPRRARPPAGAAEEQPTGADGEAAADAEQAPPDGTERRTESSTIDRSAGRARADGAS